MIQIAITVKAFAAIGLDPAARQRRYENETDERGERLIWLEDAEWRSPSLADLRAVALARAGAVGRGCF